MKVNVIGTIFGHSGYDTHTRGLANGLMKEGVDVTLTVNRPQGWERLVNDDELLALNKNPEDCDIDLFIGLPNFWNAYSNHPKKKFIGFCVWEGDKIPESWIDVFKQDRIYQIWVPSNHTKESILNTTNDKKIINKIRLVPHGVDKTKFYPIKDDSNKPFTFFTDGGWKDGIYDRKGISYLIKAFYEEFNLNDDVKLLLKINATYGVNPLIPREFPMELKPNPPKIEVLQQNIDFNELNKLYNNCDVFIISSLAEGFHLGGIQAMACSKPVLGTNFGGHTDYINEKNGWLLKNGELFEVKHDITYEGIRWKAPDIKELRETLRDIYNNRKDIQTKTLEALKTAEDYSWNNSAKKAISYLKEI